MLKKYAWCDEVEVGTRNYCRFVGKRYMEAIISYVRWNNISEENNTDKNVENDTHPVHIG